MKYLFIYEHLDQGGIETLIVRISNYLVDNDHKVLLYLERGGLLTQLLDARVEIVYTKKQFMHLLNPKKIIDLFGKEKINCIYTFGPKACFIGGHLYSFLREKNKINFFSGIYHPQEFSISGRILLRDKIHSDYFKNYLNSGSHVFMSNQVKKGIEDTINFKFNNAHIWPLAINIPDVIYRGKPDVFRIISIGRYVDFKSYNLYMFDVIDELIKRGIKVSWDVYGSGPLKEEMCKLASQGKFKGIVNINNELPYESFASVLKNASVFIGMGTTLIEAGSYGIPCIPAIAYSKEPLTYGFFNELPYYAIGEKLKHDPEISIFDLIMKLQTFSLDEYVDLREKTRNYVTEYSIDSLMVKFLSFTKKKKSRPRIKKYPRLFLVFYILISYYSFFSYKLRIRSRYSNIKRIGKGLTRS